MDCKTARMLIEFALPRSGELDQDETEALDGHLRDCLECAHAAHVELDVDQHLGRAMREVTAPPGLRERIVRRLASERRPWYRRRAGQLAAAAAVLLILGAGFGYWYGSRKAVFDINTFADNLSLAADESSPEQLERWFLETYGVKAVLPRSLNYKYFVSAERGELVPGKFVPRLSFKNLPQDKDGNPDRSANQDFAEVWILTADRFDLAKTFRAGVQAGSGRINVRLIRDPERPESVAVLILYSGDNLEWLVKPNPQPL